MHEKTAQNSMTDRERKVAMAGILTTMLLAALDQTIVAPAMPTIGGDLGHAHYLPWIVTAYLLCATATAPLFGKFSDIHGRRGTLYIALGLFLLGSLIAALAPNLFVLIGGRAIQGLGGGGLFALSQIVIGDMFPPLERSRYVAWIAAMWAIAGTAGPLLGGTLAEYYWPLIFWLNLPLGALAALVINGPLKKLPPVNHPHRLDGWGAVLLVGATSTLLLMLNWAGSTYAWLSVQIVGLGAASLVLWIAFGIRTWLASEPLVSFDVLSNRIVLTGCFAMFLISAANVGLTAYLPVYAQAYLGLSPARSGYALLGFLLGTVVGAAFAGRMAARVKRIKRIAVMGAAISGVAFIIAGLVAAQTSVIVLEILLTLVGASMGMTFPMTTISVQNGVDRMHLGVATGMLTFLRSLGSALGVAVLGAIALSHGIPLGAESSNGIIPRVADAHAFAVLFFVMGAMMLAAAAIYAVMPHKPLRGRSEPAVE
jgi:MFS family permease